MSRRLKIATIAGLLIIMAAVIVVWERVSSTRYEGRSVEEWFDTAYDMHLKAIGDLSETEKLELRRTELAFQHIGVNAVPFLASRITRDLSEPKSNPREVIDYPIEKQTPITKAKRPWFEAFVAEKQTPITETKQPWLEAFVAANILASHIRSDADQLLPLLQPALHGTNDLQRGCALLALGGVGGSKEKAWPYILKALEDSDSLIRANAARATANFTHEASQSLPEIVRIAGATNESAGAAIRALEQLGTNASAATPQLEQMLASETDKWRRKDLSDALKSIRGTSGANEPE
jgi:hypothetical protein